MSENKFCKQLDVSSDDKPSVIKQYLDLSDNSANIIKFMCDKINELPSSPENEHLQGDNLECLNRSSSLQDGRAPSPASICSLASVRRLEWDSGADVGYQPTTSKYPNSLSTLERIALDGCAESLIRTDPEGTNSCISSGVTPIHKSVTSNNPPNYSTSKVKSKTVTSPREVSGVINLTVFENNEAVSISTTNKNKDDLRKDSADGIFPSMENLSVIEITGDDQIHKSVEEMNTHSYGIVATEEGETPGTSVLHTNSASSSSRASTIIPHNPEQLSLESKKFKNHKKRITRGIQVGGTLNKREPSCFDDDAFLYPRYNSSEDGSRQEISPVNLISHPSNNCEVPKSSVLDSMGTSSFDQVNSFEYFPGDVCETRASTKYCNDELLNPGHPSKVNNSLSKDLEENIARLRDLLSRNKVNHRERKVLIKQLVERIIGSEYCDDFEDKSSSKKSAPSSKSEDKSDYSGKIFKSEQNHRNLVGNVDDVLHKAYVPYCPVPGGRTYHVKGDKIYKGHKGSSSSSVSEKSKLTTFYLPMDRVKITEHSSSTSEIREESSGCATFQGENDVGCNPKLDKVTSDLNQKWRQANAKIAELKHHCPVKETQKTKYSSTSKGRHAKPHWCSPTTKSEKKHINENTKDKPNPLLAFVDREKANQLHWIKNEINHLSNLAQLLEECTIVKSDTSTSFEEQLSLLSSLRRHKKNSENLRNDVDKFLSSSQSSPLEEPIKATIHRSPKEKRTFTSCILHQDSSFSPSMEQRSDNSVMMSLSAQSRNSSKNLTNLDTSSASKFLRNNHASKKSEAYMITFEAVSPEKSFESQSQTLSRRPLKEIKLKIPSKKGRNNIKTANDCHNWNSLKEQLEFHRPNFIKTCEERQKCLEDLARLRSLRQMTRRKLLQFSLNVHGNLHNEEKDSRANKKLQHSKLAGRSSGIHPNGFVQQGKRVKKKYHLLPEVQAREAEVRKKQNYQTNRIMADIFSRRLRKKVLNGAVSLSNSASVISSL